MGAYYSTDLGLEERKKYLNWKPSKIDTRDVIYRPQYRGVLPKSVDLRSNMPKVYDQGKLSSCTANSISAAYEYMEHPRNDWMPSRLFLYYNEREIEGTTDEDSGAYNRDGIKSLAKKGICPESDWPYDISKFTEKPPKECYDNAVNHKILTYQRIDDVKNNLKHALANGFPVVFGFVVFESFMTEEVARTGIMPMPKDGEQQLGGHSTLIVSYDDDKRMFCVRNSWNSSWGQNGYFWASYDFIYNSDWCQDFWIITKDQ